MNRIPLKETHKWPEPVKGCSTSLVIGGAAALHHRSASLHTHGNGYDNNNHALQSQKTTSGVEEVERRWEVATDTVKRCS